MFSKNKIIIFIILFAVAFRAYNIKNPFSTNGIDEGIHLLQARMISEGYNYYKDLQGDQAPLAILTFSIFRGDVIVCRYLSFFLFIISLFFLYQLSRKFGNNVALIAVLIAFLDITLLRESRLASLDLFSAALLSIASYFYVEYEDKNSTIFLLISGVFFSLSILSKMIPIFLIIFIFIRLLFARSIKHAIIFFGGVLFPLLILFSILTPYELIEGMVLRQTHRGIDLYSKLSVLVFIASCFIYLAAIKKWNLKDKRIYYIMAWLLCILIPLLLQGRTFQHHFVYISYPLSILAAIAVSEKEVFKKRVLPLFVIVNLFLAIFFISTAPKDVAYDVAEEIEEITKKNDIVVSGRPLVNILANRPAAPNLTNLAKYHYPKTELEDIIYWLEKNETKAIILYYHLYEIEGLKEYLNRSTNWYLYKRIEGRGQLLFEGISLQFSRDVYEIYVKR